jgi:hypothetical protein
LRELCFFIIELKKKNSSSNFFTFLGESVYKNKHKNIVMPNGVSYELEAPFSGLASAGGAWLLTKPTRNPKATGGP